MRFTRPFPEMCHYCFPGNVPWIRLGEEKLAHPPDIGVRVYPRLRERRCMHEPQRLIGVGAVRDQTRPVAAGRPPGDLSHTAAGGVARAARRLVLQVGSELAAVPVLRVTGCRALLASGRLAPPPVL